MVTVAGRAEMYKTFAEGLEPALRDAYRAGILKAEKLADLKESLDLVLGGSTFRVC